MHVQHQQPAPDKGTKAGVPKVLQAFQPVLGKHDDPDNMAVCEIQASEDREAIKDTVLQHHWPLLMMYVPEKSQQLRMLHSPTLCPQDAVPEGSEVGGKVFGFQVKNNTPVLIPAKKWWDWNDVNVPVGTEAVAALNGTGSPSLGTRTRGEKKRLPYTRIVPPSLADVAHHWVSHGYTSIKCYADLCTKFPDADDFADEKEWLLAASQGVGPSFAKNQLGIAVSVADQDEQQFDKWCQQVLTQKQVLRPTPPLTTPAQQPLPPPPLPAVDPTTVYLAQHFSTMHQQQQQANHQQLLAQAQMMNQLWSVAGGGGGGGAGYLASGRGKSMQKSEDTWASLCSLANVRSVQDLPMWWNLTHNKRKEDINNVWKTAKEMIIKWAQTEGLAINKSFQPDNDVIWSWMAGDFSSSKDFASGGVEGLSPYAAQPVTAAELDSRKKTKAAEDASAHNRSLAEAVHIETGKGELPSPPGELESLKKTLTVFTGIVWLLFGERCNLFTKLLDLVYVLDDEEVERNSHLYTGIKARQIFWMVLVDAKRYCNSSLTAAQFKQGRPFPSSGLANFTTQVREAADIHVMGFPDKWRVAAPTVPTTPRTDTAVMWNATHMTSGLYGQPLPPFPLTMPTPPVGLQQQQIPLGGQENKDNLPPRVSQACQRVFALFPEAKLPHFVTAAGLQMAELPKIRGQVTCYNHLMGLCGREGQRGHKGCNFVHFEIVKLQAAEYEEWIQIMEKGAAKIEADKALPELSTRKRKWAGGQ